MWKFVMEQPTQIWQKNYKFKINFVSPIYSTTQWQIQDFPDGGSGHQSLMGGMRQSIIWPIFAENCIKMKKIGQGCASKILLRNQQQTVNTVLHAKLA